MESRSRDVSRDPFFCLGLEGLFSVSKDFGFGLELFVSRLFIGYFFLKFCKKEFLKKMVLKNDCSNFNRSKRSVAMLSLLLRCLRVGENNLPSTPFKIYSLLNSIKNVHVPMKLQRVISATRGWEYFAQDYL